MGLDVLTKEKESEQHEKRRIVAGPLVFRVYSGWKREHKNERCKKSQKKVLDGLNFETWGKILSGTATLQASTSDFLHRCLCGATGGWFLSAGVSYFDIHTACIMASSRLYNGSGGEDLRCSVACGILSFAVRCLSFPSPLSCHVFLILSLRSHLHRPLIHFYFVRASWRGMVRC